jgi:sugar phosphate isomerase/epimerase
VAGDDPIELLREVADRVVSMHASDRYLAEGMTLEELRQDDGTLGYSPNLRHGVVGKGLNDYDAIFTILAEIGYHRWVSIEDGMNGIEEMKESIEFLKRMRAKHFKP